MKLLAETWTTRYQPNYRKFYYNMFCKLFYMLSAEPKLTQKPNPEFDPLTWIVRLKPYNIVKYTICLTIYLLYAASVQKLQAHMLTLAITFVSDSSAFSEWWNFRAESSKTYPWDDRQRDWLRHKSWKYICLRIQSRRYLLLIPSFLCMLELSTKY